MISTIITAFVSFVSTNIDDIFVLMLFFSQINNNMTKRHIIIGQYFGIGALTVISIIGALGVSVIPHEYVGLLGLIPIFLGVKEFIDYKKESKDKKNTEQQEHNDIDNSELEERTYLKENSIITFSNSFINPSILKVASVTLANGGDNIGIYIPLFTRMSLRDILITVVVFALLILLMCFLALRVVEKPLIQGIIEKYKHIFIPIIFIGLGIFILTESDTIALVYKSLR